MSFIADFEEALVVLPVVVPLDALLPGGIHALEDARPALYRALRTDDLEAALDESAAWWEENDGEDLAAALSRALLLAKVERTDDARAVLDRAAADDRPELGLVEVDLALECGDVERAEKRLDQVWSRCLDLEPRRPGVWRFAGDLFLDLEDEDRAAEAYQRAVDAGTEDYETVFRLAELQRERENWSAAGEAFDRAAELSEGAVGPRSAAAECWNEAGNLERALEARAALLEHRSGDAEAWARQGIGYRELGRHDAAAEALERATRLAPDRSLYWIELAHLHRRRGRLEEAIRGYREVLDEEGPLIDALEGLASAVLEQGDLDRAERVARRAVATDDDSARARALLARVLAERGEVEEAFEAARRADELADDEPEYRRLRASLAVEAGREEAGLEVLESMATSKAAGADAAHALARALLRTNRYGRLYEFAGSWDGDAWGVVAPVFELLGGALADDRKTDPADAAERFTEHVRRLPDAVPVERDLRELRRYAMAVPGEEGDLVESMLDVLEGHREIDRFAAGSAGSAGGTG
ncbi:MAG: tetratricopeptide repeat protein [Bradymonadaceae bacterium]